MLMITSAAQTKRAPPGRQSHREPPAGRPVPEYMRSLFALTPALGAALAGALIVAGRDAELDRVVRAPEPTVYSQSTAHSQEEPPPEQRAPVLLEAGGGCAVSVPGELVECIERRGAFRGARLAGKRHGRWIMRDASGAIRRERYYAHGLRVGPYVSRYASGALRTEGQFRHDRRVGRWVWWHEDGTLNNEREYVDGQLHGWARDWHPNGEMAGERRYDRGEKEGLERAWRSDGSLRRAIPYHNGDAHGWARYWRRTGELAGESRWENGVLRDRIEWLGSLRIVYYRNGTKVRQRERAPLGDARSGGNE